MSVLRVGAHIRKGGSQRVKNKNKYVDNIVFNAGNRWYALNSTWMLEKKKKKLRAALETYLFGTLMEC